MSFRMRDLFPSKANKDNSSQHMDEERGVLVDEYGEQAFSYAKEESDYINHHPSEVILQWQGPEYEIHPKSALWYTCAIVFLAGMAFWAVWTNSFIVATLFILIGIVGFLYLNIPPRVVDYAITTEGFVVGNHIHYFEEIESFWIIYEPPHTRVISLRVDGHIFPHHHIPLHQLDPVDLREVLEQYVPEVRQQENLVDFLERLLKI